MAIDDYYKNISPLQSTQIKPASVTSSALDPALKPSVGGYTNPMLEQQKLYGPKLAEAAQSYPGALQAARTAQATAYDNSEKLYSGYNAQLSEPGKNDMWGRFGAAMLQPTTTGSWAEGFGNAATAAMDARSNYRDKESMRQEKLMRSQLALEQLRAEKPNAELGSIEDQMKAYELFGKVGAVQSEIDLGNGPTPDTDDALIADYNKNPNKYISPRGQAMVESARSRIATQGERQWELQKMGAQGEIDIAKEQAKLKAKGSDYEPDAGSRKSIRENDASNVALQQSLVNLNKAHSLSGYQQDEDGKDTETPLSNSGYLARPRATYAESVPDWMAPDFVFGSPEQAKNTNELGQIMDLEAIKGVGEFLKGPTSDRDVALMLSTLSDPNASPQRKQAAVDRVRRQVEAQIKFNEEYNQELKTGKAYDMGNGGGGGGGQEQTPPSPKDVVGKFGGREVLWEDILHTAEQNNMTPEEVYDKLNGGK